ncbi:DUF3426 domain-containing protein [Xanthomonas fragariae]|uniref:DUF3426 domain-containing protein n=1 Tax=Xanthomonas fragariae TaxID=48664 RepID=UPI000A35C66F|nr:DUF3426 domain-containing protein [Xanthomonas fragariae]SMQ96844.1 Hypothetical Protein NBC2815_03526 [Xanthomonas fragariae]
MSQTPPPHRPLATFLRATPAALPLIPTPVLPPAEPPELALPVPSPELPPAPVPELVAAPLAPMVPAPATPVDRPLRVDAPTTHHDGRYAAVPMVPTQAPALPTPPHPDAPATEMTRHGDHGSAAADAATVDLLHLDAPDMSDVSTETTICPETELNLGADPTSGRSNAAESETPSPRGLSSDDADATPAINAPIAAHPQQLPAPALAVPTFAGRGLTRPRLRASGRHWALLLGLVGVLGLQIVIADRAHLAGNARWRPLVGAACAVARCTLPAWREPAALTLLNRDVRPLPGMPGVLQIEASFRNDARWAQAWPWLQLSLSDADGRVIGTRVLAPQEYLGQLPAGQDTLGPGQAVQVEFRVREPAASTVAFSFDFR